MLTRRAGDRHLPARACGLRAQGNRASLGCLVHSRTHARRWSALVYSLSRRHPLPISLFINFFQLVSFVNLDPPPVAFLFPPFPPPLSVPSTFAASPGRTTIMSQRKGTAARSAAASSKESVQVVDASISASPSLSLATDPLPTVRVNKSHLAEIKTSLDDIVKKVCVCANLVHCSDESQVTEDTPHFLLGQADETVSRRSGVYALAFACHRSSCLRICVLSYLAGCFPVHLSEGNVLRGEQAVPVDRSNCVRRVPICSMGLEAMG